MGDADTNMVTGGGKPVSQWRGGVGTRGTRTISGQESGDDSCLHIGGRWMKLGED